MKSAEIIGAKEKFFFFSADQWTQIDSKYQRNATPTHPQFRGKVYFDKLLEGWPIYIRLGLLRFLGFLSLPSCLTKI